jgi:uncharacterized membrane protein YcaP (DUF421 family)
MKEDDHIRAMDWQRMFLPDNIPPQYLWEIAVRTIFMFLFLIIVLKFLSKRGVKQLSVFELAILIALGSATGDPMFYHNVPVTHGIAVLVVVIILYRVITSLTARFKLMELVLEGKPKCLLRDGVIDYPMYKKLGLPYDKFFAELRLKGVDQLGQLRTVYLETSGEMSVYYLPDEAVKPGLQIFPEILSNPITTVTKQDQYACVHCGQVQHLSQGDTTCSICENNQWTKASAAIRVK